MIKLEPLLLLALTVGVRAGAYQNEGSWSSILPPPSPSPPPEDPTALIPRCSTDCPVTRFQKFMYVLNRSYTYEYFGQSKIQLTGVEGGASVTDWSATVHVKWIGGCDLVLTVKDFKVDGDICPPHAHSLGRYPLVMALNDGLVHHVCTDPNDDVWSINIKKGVASALQNSLPSLSTLGSGLNLTETDVVGKCSTHYTVDSEGDRVLVKKTKDHRMCQERYPTPAETHVPWLKGPLPVEESGSVCEQEIKNGIYWSIKCEDRNVIRPIYGAYKYVVATQESTIRLLSGCCEQPPADISAPVQSIMVQGSLLYSYDTLKKDPTLMDELDQTMKEICENTEEGVERGTAALVAKALRLLRRVPGENIEKILEKIRKKHYCTEYRRLESLFLDAVAFVRESGAVRVIVKALKDRRATGIRAAFYTVALFLLPRPNTYAMEELKPLFESSRLMPLPTLAAATMVNTYCRHVPICHHDTTITNLAEALSNRLGNHSSTGCTHVHRKTTLTALKALGNMGVMTDKIYHSVMSCLGAEDVKTNIRVAAAQVFRHTRCNDTITSKLVNIVLDSTKNTEVRIASYLTSVRCIQQEDLGRIISKISREVNTQVRGFILSHLTHVRESNDPGKTAFKRLFSTYKLPTDYMEDFRRFSRNMDLSYYVPSLGAGAGVDTNIIYAPGSFVPRSIDYNLTTILEGIGMNIGEVGARIEGLDAIIVNIFGPKSPLRNGSAGKLLNDLANFVGEGGKEILERLYNAFQQKDSTDLPLLSSFLDKLYSYGNVSDTVEADMFIRYMGQELIFASFEGNPMTSSAHDGDETFPGLDDSSRESDILNIDSVRTAQLDLDYSFPTIQGTPLKLELRGTAVAGLKFQGNFSLAELFSSWRNSGESSVKIIPSLSVETKGFVGYDSFLYTTGLKTDTNVSSISDLSIVVKIKNQTDIQIYLDVPQKTELFELETETYLMKGVICAEDTRIIPEPMRDVRFRRQSCFTGLESMLGLKFCYDINVPDVFRSNSLPLGAPAVAKVYIEKAEPSMRGYLMKAALENKENSRMLKLDVEATGATIPREFEIVFNHTVQEDSFSASATVRSFSFRSGVWLTVVSEENFKSAQTYVSVASNDTEFSRGIKLDLKTPTSPSEGGYEAHAYSSPSPYFLPESQVIDAKLTHRVSGSNGSLDIACRTKNGLRDYIDLSLEFGADFRATEDSDRATSTELRHFDFRGGLGGWALSSSINRTKESNETVQFSSAFKVAHRAKELVSVVATSTAEEHLDQSSDVSTDLRVKIGREQYKAALYLHTGHFKYGGSFQIISSETNRTILDLEAYVSHYNQLYHAKFLLDIPDLMRLIKFEGKATERRAHHYMTQVGLLHGPRLVFHIDGPVTILFSSQILKLTTNLQINTLANGPLNLDFAVISSISEKVFSLSLAKQEPLLAVAWIMKAPSAEEMNIQTKLLLPAVVDFTVDGSMTQEDIQLDVNTLLLPHYSFARRIRLSNNISLEQRNGTVDFLWDADGDPSQKISVYGAVTDNSSSSYPNRTVIHGNMAYLDKIYPFTLDLPTVHLSIYHTGEQGFDLEVTTPEQKTLGLEMKVNIVEEASTFVSALSHFCYKSLEDKQYKFNHVIYLEKLGNPYTFKVETGLNFTSPEGHVTTVNVDAKHSNTDEERLVNIQTAASNYARQSPLHVQFFMNNKVNSYVTRATTLIGSTATMFRWQLEAYPQGGVKDLESAVDLNAIRRFLDTILQMASLTSGGYERSTYRHRYHKATPSTYSVLHGYPSHTVQAEASYSPSQTSLTSYPNKDESEARYEVGVHYSHKDWDQQSSYQGHLSHPSLTRDVRVEVRYGGNGENVTGKIELDIFPDTEDKITGTFESARISDSSVKCIAHIATRVLKENPQITIVTAYSQQKVGFDFEFQKNATAPASINLLSLYEQVSEARATVALSLSMDGDSVVFVSGTMRDEDEEDCFGTRMWGKTRTSLLGNYDLESRVCEPAYFEVTSKKEEGDGYTIKLGVQGEEKVEFSVAGEEEGVIARASVSLPSHNLVEVDMTYESSKFNTMKSDAWNVSLKVGSAISSWARMVYETVKQEAQEQGLIFPNPELLSLVMSVESDLRRIWQELIYEPVVSRYEALCHMMKHSAIFTHFKRLARRMWSAMVQMQQDLRFRILQELLTWPKYFKGIAQKFIRVIKEVAQIMETGQLSGTVRTILNQWERLKFLRVLADNINTLFQQHPEEYNAVKHVATNIMDSLQQDLENIRRKYMDIPAVQTTVHWITENLNRDHKLAKEMDKKIARIIQDAVFLSLNTGSYYVRLRIPLQARVGSLTRAFLRLFPDPETIIKKLLWIRHSNISPTLKDMIWVYYTLIPRHISELLPPYNQTAVAVDGTELITFDGSLLRAPRSDCALLLASYASSRVTIVHPETADAAQVTFMNPHTNVTVKPDFGVEIDGREMNTSHAAVGEILVEKSPYEVKVVSPYMTVRVDKEEHTVFVEISGWSFGQAAGILGNYDGEVANDWLMPSGERATDLQNLVSSWQEDESCPTPPIRPIEHNFFRDGQCGLLLYGHELCFPLVNPAPYTKMCLATDNICDPVYAYDSICTSKGLDLELPSGCW